LENSENILVKDIMTKDVITVDSSATANNAAKIMEDYQVGSVVITENNTPIGIITDRDFAIKIVAHAYPVFTNVKQVMSSPLIAISPDESIYMAADLLHTRKIRKLPVIDNDKVIGIVTATDIVNEFLKCTDSNTQDPHLETICKIYDRRFRL